MTDVQHHRPPVKEWLFTACRTQDIGSSKAATTRRIVTLKKLSTSHNERRSTKLEFMRSGAYPEYFP